jgi:hypothetical protein
MKFIENTFASSDELQIETGNKLVDSLVMIVNNYDIQVDYFNKVKMI